MPSLLLVVFLVELAIQVVNSLGADTISNALWKVYCCIPSRRSAVTEEQRKLQLDYLELRRELHATSSQDEFAKWARLRRQHDKLLEQLEAKKSSLDTGRRSFDSVVTVSRLVLTRGLQYFLPFWFARAPMFWLPHGWFPGYAEWLLAFPRAPRGSVSITSWQLACLGVLVLLRDTVQALLALSATTETKDKTPAARESPVAAQKAG
ncbi:chd5 domain containing protein [Grosmannia clavigera kw1407]|uniref:Chd5 domain containing protein n=1 Tax=Grosmannia clavigera (strain kw1407 / UAMH 11150) TaxID=655863 RepID=F0XTN5_GROCL|nr:chd5 domain containing protein [Grosmannia clavigera kw1407]EFW98539.1 chd5 domain containing protein [Grosmannia clavigera kw1407]